MITNDSASNANLPLEKRKTFLYEYMSDGRLFKIDEVDMIIIDRLSKNKDENKLIYLFQSFKRVEQHLYSKSATAGVVDQKQIAEIKEQIVNFFCSCFLSPESFEISNDKIEQVLDNEGGAQGQDLMFMAMMGGGQGMG